MEIKIEVNSADFTKLEAKQLDALIKALELLAEIIRVSINDK